MFPLEGTCRSGADGAEVPEAFDMSITIDRSILNLMLGSGMVGGGIHDLTESWWRVIGGNARIETRCHSPSRFRGCSGLGDVPSQ
jgi:hypothetical protein